MGWPLYDRMFEAILGVHQRVALITGGASGIGAAASELFAASGMNVHILDFNEVGGNEHCEHVESQSYPGKCVFHKLDVTSREACDAVVAEIAQANGGNINVLFNCAGLSKRDANMTTDAERDQLWNVNVNGTINMCEAVVPTMLQCGRGRIINMGSAVGFPHIAFPLGLLYKKSKEETHRYTRELALRLALHGITVNALAPGRVLTPLVTMPEKGWVALEPDPGEAFRGGCATQASGTMLKTEEVATMALFLCSPFLGNVNGHVLDMTSCWAIGHQPYAADKMPAAFVPFRDWAQTTTDTKITP